MSEEEKKETDEKKLKESKEGKQYVGNTEEAKGARRDAAEDQDGEKEEDKDEDEGEGEEEDGDVQGEPEGEEEYVEDDGEEDDEEDDGSDNDEEGKDGNKEKADGDKAKTGQKRGRGKQSSATNKKQKDNSGKGKQNGGTVGSKHDSAEAPAPAGSADRLPKKGQKVQWKSLPGYVDGEVVEIVYEEKEVDGKQVKGKKNDPRIVLKSSSSGKTAVHKPEAVYFD